MSAVLAKKYTNPSSDIITVVSGLDHIDTVFTEFVGALDWIMRNGKTSEHVGIQRWALLTTRQWKFEAELSRWPWL